jgi:hypothetical protein
MDNDDWTAIVRNTPEFIRAFHKYTNARTWAEAIYYLGMCADLEGLPLVCEKREDGSLYVCVEENEHRAGYGIGGIEGEADRFFYIGG